MLTISQWIYLVCILLCAFVGGYFPIVRPQQARSAEGFPLGEAFSAGVFLALSLLMLLPSAFHVFGQALPSVDYPVASVVAIVAFLVLLAIEHLMGHLVADVLPSSEQATIPATIPLVMTCMIATPSFFLGMALGISDPAAAALIFVAIMLHKGTAAFALALAMIRSTMSRWQIWLLFTAFAFTTPLGVLAGGMARDELTAAVSTLEAVVLALGAGTFLYMGTLHELKRASLIQHCCKPSCFVAMLAGLSITALVRWLVGEAHHL